MTTSAQTVARRVVTLLNDLSSTRWTLIEVVRAINEGQLAFLQHRPDLLSVTATVTLVAGTRQTLPAAGAKFLKAFRNNSSASKAAVRLALMEHLDAQRPGWYSDAQSASIAHYMTDAREVRVFHVYPPATNTAALEVMYAAYPTVIADPASTTLPADPSTDQSAPTVVLGNITVPDDMVVPLVDYAMFRLLSKNANAADLQRATSHYQAFALALGIDARVKLATGPTANSPFNPTHPAMTPPASAV